MIDKWPWVAMALLGAYHGLNPAMGWLFALALGLQEKRRSAVLAALLPIALGHAAAIAVAILVLTFVQHFLPMHLLKWAVAAVLFSWGYGSSVRIIREVRACELEERTCLSGLSSWHPPTGLG